MTKEVLTIHFHYKMTTEELKEIMSTAAPAFAGIPGCCWKLWLLNEDRKEGGGVYLFASPAALSDYLSSDLFASVSNNPAFNDFQTNSFNIAETASIITNAPLMDPRVPIPILG